MQNELNTQKSLVSGLNRRLEQIEQEKYLTIGQILGLETIVCPEKGIEIQFRNKSMRFDTEGRIMGENSKPITLS